MGILRSLYALRADRDIRQSSGKRDKVARRLKAVSALMLEPLEERMLMAIGTGPDLVELVPDGGAPLLNGDIRHVSPRELLLRFDATQSIDPTTLDAIQLIRSGGEGYFSSDVVSSAVVTGASVTSFSGNAALSAVDDFYNGKPLTFTSGPLTGQTRNVLDYTGATRTFTLAAALPSTPMVGAAFQVNLNTSPDQVLQPAFKGLGDRTNEVVLRFAERLPEDLYRVHIVGSGAAALENTNDQPFNGGANLSINFELDLPAQIVGVVPQPVSRTPGGALTYENPDTPAVDAQEGLRQIEVYFDTDISQLINSAGPGGIRNPAYYQLLFTNGTATTADDLVFTPTTVHVPTQVPGQTKVILEFNLADLGHVDGGVPETVGTYRLRIGNDEAPLPTPTMPLIVPGVEPGSSFVTADTSVGTLGAAARVIAGRTDVQAYNLTLPGAGTDPGHRQVPGVSHLTGVADITPGITTVYYDFRQDYGKDQLGVTQTNQISPQQKDRVREIFDLYSRYLGIQFIETNPAVNVASPVGSITIAAGLLGAVDPAVASGLGNQTGIAGAPNPAFPAFSSQLVVMDVADFSGAAINQFGQQFMRDTMQRIGSLLGFDIATDLPDPTINGTNPSNIGNAFESLFPGDADILHGQHLYRPDSNDIDLYRFEIAAGQHGVFTAETFAERLADSSSLDTTLSLYGDVTVLHLPRGIDLADGKVFTISDGFNPAITFEFNSVGSVATGNRAINYLPSDTKEQIAAKVADALSDAPRLDIDPVVEGDTIRLLGVSSVNLATSAPAVTQTTVRELLARNDDFYSEDSLIELRLRPGSYYVGVTSTGNVYNPEIADSGFGGTTDGRYELRLEFRPDPTSPHNLTEAVTPENPTGLLLDGDGDGRAGGVFNFHFQASTATNTIYVDKVAVFPLNQLGTLSNPFNNFQAAIGAAQGTPGRDIIRIVANGGDLLTGGDGDLDTLTDNITYELGTNSSGSALADGTSFRVPKGTTVMIDPGVIIKLREANIEVGSTSTAAAGDRSQSHLQVLGVPGREVIFTSYHNEALGKDLDPSLTNPARGDWGGLVFRNDVDRIAGRTILEDQGVFLNYVNHANLSYGGGDLLVGIDLQTFNPIYMIESRPTITHNTITNSAEAAMSADPNSFAESRFQDHSFGPIADASNTPVITITTTFAHGLRTGDRVRVSGATGNTAANGDFAITVTGATTFQIAAAGNGAYLGSGQWAKITAAGQIFAYTADYDRTGPDIHGNRLSSYEPGLPLEIVGATQATPVAITTAVPHGFANGDRVRISGVQGNEAANGDWTVVVTGANTFTLTGSVGTGAYVASPGDVVQKLTLATNSFNALFVRIETKPGELRTLETWARWDDTDIVHMLAENLVIRGQAGGPIDEDGPGPLAAAARLDGRLRVDPGVIVKLAGSRIETQFGAQFLAEGTAEHPVLFVSLKDDRYGAGGTFDTNNDGRTTTPAQGNWGGLYFSYLSHGSLDHARLANGGGETTIEGGFANFNVVEVHRADVRLANSVIENNASGLATTDRNGRGRNVPAAVFVRGAQPAIINNVFRNDGPEGPAAISIDVNSLNGNLVPDAGRSTGAIDAQTQFANNFGALVRLNTFINNDTNGMIVRGGSVTTESVWDDTDVVHVVFDEITVGNLHGFGGVRLQSAPDEQLVVKLEGANAGFTATGRPLDIEDRLGGAVQVVGTPGFPVAMTSYTDDSVAGDTNNDGSTTTTNNVDVFLLLDDTGSFQGSLPALQAVFPQIVTRLQAGLPGANLAFGVGRFEDYGSTGFFNPDHAFILNQPIISPSHPQFNAAINAALARSSPGSGGDGPETTIEGLYQVATGLGFDGNGDGDTTDNGPAGLVATQTTGSTAATSDVPAFSSFVPDPTGPVIAPIGTEGGVGFRTGSTRIVLLATDIGTAYQPDGINPYTGVAGSTVTAALMQSGGRNTTPGGRGAGIQQTVNALIANNIQVIGLGTTNIPTFAPRSLLEGLSLLTGAVDSSGNPLYFQISINNAQQVADAIVDGVLGVGTTQWRSVLLQQFSNDRNVETTTELEVVTHTATPANNTPGAAQYLGELAPDQLSGSDDRRLGFQVQGYLNSSDVDVYSFVGRAGTEIWIDIDRTTPGLDTIVELVDETGAVLARSNNSAGTLASSDAYNAQGFITNVSVPTSLSNPTGFNFGRRMQRDAFTQISTSDLYSSNIHDAGMRVVLPFLSGATDRYYIRVRSNSPDLSIPDLGRTTGSYQMQLRLQETDEFPGSTVQRSDIRFAANAVDIQGLPKHSPLLGDTAERQGDTVNELFAGALPVGNMLQTDRGALSIAGALETATDVDWYSFSLDHELVLTANRTWATIFDIDYADGLNRPDTGIAVYSSTGQLLYLGRDSDVLDDRDLAGTTQLSAGSYGTRDPYIGSAQLPAGLVGGASRTYVVAVFSNSQIPNALDATFTLGSANRTVRLEPLNSIQRIAEDHIGVNGYTTGTPATGTSLVAPQTSLFDISSGLALDVHVRPFTLSDVTLYVSTGTTVQTVDPATGALETNVGTYPGGVQTLRDIAFRSDGRLHGVDASPGGASDPGFLAQINPGTAGRTQLGGDNLLTLNDSLSALAYRRSGVNAGTPTYELYYASGDNAGGSRLVRANATNGSATGAAPVNSGPLGPIGTGIFFAVPGDRGITTGMAFIDGTLYGVSNTGRLYTINLVTGRVDLDLANNVGTSFAGLSLGPQNLDLNNDGLGDLRRTLFAISDAGQIFAFDEVGAPVVLFDTDANNVADSSSISTFVVIPPGEAVTGVAFSTLDFNLWHPTLRGRNDAGHGTTSPFDGSRSPALTQPVINGRTITEGELAGGASFYFGLENHVVDPDVAGSTSYFDYGVNAQYGILTPEAHQDLVSATGIAANTYDLPGGAHGSLVTNSFSLQGYGANDKPTLYFNYLLRTENAGGNTAGSMRDAARVFVSSDNGLTWSMVATNNSDRSGTGELPQSFTTSAIVPGADPARQRVQELFETPTVGDRTWRQARVDLSEFAGQGNLLLRFDFSTAGDISDPSAPAGSIYGVAMPGDALGGFNSNLRGQNNPFEGFYVDDIVIGFAERGEMVTGAVNQNTIVPLPALTGFPPQTLNGAYQLEIRRGEEYATALTGTGIAIDPTLVRDTNDRLVQGFTIQAVDGAGILDGQTFQISDGVKFVTFEFETAGGVTAGNVAISVNGADAVTPDSATVIAGKIRDAINAQTTIPAADRVNVKANVVPTSNLVELFGAAEVLLNGTARNLTIDIQDASINESGVGNATQVTVTRTGPLDAALTVSIVANLGEVSIPLSVMIPAMQDSATFPLVALNDADVEGTQAIEVKATAAGFNSITEVVDIVDDDLPGLILTVMAVVSESGPAFLATVKRNTVDNSKPLTVTIVSSDPSEAIVASVTLLPNDDEDTFTITPIDDSFLDGNQPVTITAYAPGFPSVSALLTVTDDVTDPNPAPAKLALSITTPATPIPENAGTRTASVSLPANTLVNLDVTLASSDVGIATVPAIVTILAGTSSRSFDITAVPDAIADGTQTVAVTATAAGLESVINTIDVADAQTPALTLSIAPSPVSEGAGAAAAMGTVTRNTPTDFDLVVTLYSHDRSDATAPTSVTILAGQASASFPINAVNELVNDGPVTANFTASAMGLASGRANVVVDATDDLDVYDRRGDENIDRPQGQVIIANNIITSSAQAGIRVDAAARGTLTAQPHPGSVRNLEFLNDALRLAPGITIENNLIAVSGQFGILFSGDPNTTPNPLAATPFGRIVNNTLYGGPSPAGVGIQVTDFASPTILNNIVSNFVTGVLIDTTAEGAGTVMGGTVYKGNTTNASTGAIGTGSFPILLANDNQPANVLFRDPNNGDFRLRQGSQAIDSSINVVPERSELDVIYTSLGIELTPVTAPLFDITGALRQDNPLVNSPPGQGAQVFKDRGAIERLDPVAVTVDDLIFNELNVTTNAIVVVRLSEPAVTQLTVVYTTGNGTAEAGTDYTATTGTLTFAIGDLTQRVTVPVLGDTRDELDETFFVTISNISLGAQITDPQGQVTIRDDDAPPSFSIGNFSLSEGDDNGVANLTTPFVFTVSLDAPSGKETRVQFVTRDGTATVALGDYLATTGTLTFAPGQVSQTLTVQVNADAVVEDNETFFVDLFGAVDASIGTISGNGVIQDDEPIIGLSNITQLEGNAGLTPFVFVVTLHETSPINVFVDFETVLRTPSATSASASDFNSISGTALIPAFALSTTITVNVVGDTLGELDELFDLRLFNPANGPIQPAKFDATNTATQLVRSATIDDDEPLVTISSVSVNEGDGNAVFTVSLVGTASANVTVNYATADATATQPADYTNTAGALLFVLGETVKTITVPIVADVLNENSETFTVTLSGAVNSLLANGQATLAVTGTIVDDDPLPTVTIGDVALLEGDAGFTDFVFPVQLSPSTGSGRNVFVSYSTAADTAANGLDFQSTSGTLTFAPGQTLQNITVRVIGDPTLEGDETFLVNLAIPTPVTASLADPQGTGTILNDEGRVQITGVTREEGDSGLTNFVFNVVLNKPDASNPVVVGFATADGGGPNPARSLPPLQDYLPTAGTLTFAPGIGGPVTQQVVVQVVGDLSDEFDETFLVNLTSGEPLRLINNQATGVILNIDPTIGSPDPADIPPTVSIVDASVAEGDVATTNVVFDVVLSAPSGKVITVGYTTANGGSVNLATAGVDYNSATNTLTFLPGQATQKITVQALGDLEGELNETFLVNLTSVSATATIDDGQAVGTIVDNEPRVTVTGVTVTEGDVNSMAEFVVRLSKASDSNQFIRVAYVTEPGVGPALANDPADYLGTTGATITFSPGETVKSIFIPVVGDLLDEDDETFGLRLTSAVNALLQVNLAEGRIVDNDPLPVVTINDVTVTEGNAGPTSVVLDVALTAISGRQVTVVYATANGTATLVDGDYLNATGTLTFAPGQTTNQISLTVQGDNRGEPNESFVVTLSNVVNALTPDTQGSVTITDDEPRVFILDPTALVEGNLLSQNMVFEVRLDRQYGEIVTVQYATAPGTAVSPADFTSTSGTLTFAINETSQFVTVSVQGDLLDENDESFVVTLSAPSTNAVILDATATGSITDDDGQPSITILDATATEGNVGTTDAVFRVLLSAVSGLQVQVPFEVVDDTATVAGNDYNDTNGVVTFAPGVTEQFITVQVKGDTLGEVNETLQVILNTPANATLADPQGIGTILDNEPRISIADKSIVEADSTLNLVFDVTLSTVSSGNVTVAFSTAPISATAGQDYTPVVGVVTFQGALNETLKTLTVPIVGDLLDELDEEFLVSLSGPSTNAVILDGSAVGTIVDNDAAPSISIGDAIVTEGHSAAINMVFPITLSQPSGQVVTVAVDTLDSSATGGVDYVPLSSTVTFNAGETRRNVTVQVIGDREAEANETLLVNLSNPTPLGTPVIDSQAVGTILDDEPVLSIDPTTVTEGNGDVSAVFLVRMDRASTQTVTVLYSTTNGTAVAPGDYLQVTQGTLSFLAGQVQAQLTVTVHGDLLNEPSENFTVSLNSVLGQNAHAGASALGTILNDDAQPALSIGSPITVVEGAPLSSIGAEFPVTLSAPSGQIVTVAFNTLNGTAQSGSGDYDATTGTLTFLAGETSRNITVQVRGDNVGESNETFLVQLQSPVNASVAVGLGTGIIDDDEPLVSISDATVVETEAGVTAVFSVTLDIVASGQVDVSYTTEATAGTATPGVDYVAIPSGLISFLAGETSKTISVTVLGDTLDENNETFFVNLTGFTPNIVFPTDSQGAGTIVDNDPLPLLSLGDATATEGDGGPVNLRFVVLLSTASGRPVTVNFATASQTALAVSDFVFTSGAVTFNPNETSKEITVQVVGDLVGELDETFTVSLGAAANATISDGLGVGLIQDDDPRLFINDVTVTEGDASTVTASFNVTLSRASLSPITVAYNTAAGAALAGLDYQPTSGLLSFAPGVQTQTVSVVVLGDLLNENDETFFVNLSSPGGTVIVDGQGVGTIANNDPLPNLSINSVSVVEGDGGAVNAVFTVTMTPVSGRAVNVEFLTTPLVGAVAGVDFVPATGTLTFNASQTQQQITVVVNGDLEPEPNETFQVSLFNATNANISSSTGTGTIVDDEPRISISDVTVVEPDVSGTINAVFTVSMNRTFSLPVSVAYNTADLSALSGSDYQTGGGTVTILAGSTTAQVTVAVLGDAVAEASESYVVNLSTPVNGVIMDSQGLGAILDNDPAISINNVTVAEATGPLVPAVFTVTLSQAPTVATTVVFSTSNGTATAGQDYSATGGTLTFAVGVTSRTVTVNVVGDALNEDAETFNVTLSAPINGVLSQAVGVGLISDNDALPEIRINDLTVVEGTGANGQAVFNLTLNVPSGRDVSVDVATAVGSGNADSSDFVATAGVVTFAPGVTALTVTVPVVGDSLDEPNETFVLNLSTPINATLPFTHGTATILDDDFVISVIAAPVNEGDVSTANAVFTVSLSKAAPTTVTRSFTTVNGTATAGTDYTAASGTLSFTPGQTAQQITVTVLGDVLDEVNETFSLLVSDGNVANNVTGQTTIVDNDPAPNLVIGGATLTEGASGSKNFVFTATLSAVSGRQVTAVFNTASDSAVAGSDFTATTGTLTFAPGQTTAQVTVAVSGDVTIENHETFFVNLSGAVGANATVPQGVGRILNDDIRHIFVTGADAGGGPHVRVYDSITGAEKFGFYAYHPNFNGGVRVAAGDVNGDSVPDVVTVPGSGGGPHLKVLDGTNGQLIYELYAFESDFGKGLQVTMGDVNGDGRADIIVGTDGIPGDTLARVRVFDGPTGSLLRNLNLDVSTGLHTGVRVAAGDIDGDGLADLILGSAAGVPPRIIVANALNAGTIVTFQPYVAAFQGGVYVAAGDFNGDGTVDIFTGAGAGGGPHVKVFNGLNPTGAELASFYAYSPLFGGGVRVGSTDFNADGRADVVTAAGPGGGPHVRIFSGLGLAELQSFYAYAPIFGGGVFVGGSFRETGAALLAAEPAANPRSGAITEADVYPVLQRAIADWTAAGLDARMLERLASVEVRIADLPGEYLATAHRRAIMLDGNAAGHGWFIDPTPWLDEEFEPLAEGSLQARQDVAAASGMDLKTVLAHELGHILGLEHSVSDAFSEALMAESLTPGTRRGPAAEDVDSLFAEDRWD